MSAIKDKIKGNWNILKGKLKAKIVEEKGARKDKNLK